MRYQHTLPKPRYVVMPATIRHWGPGQKETVPGIAVEFRDHTFDSEEAQLEFGWSDEQRQQVEQHLERHLDYGVMLRNLDAADLEAATKATIMDGDVRCQMIAFDNGAPVECTELADLTVDDDHLLCARHRSEIEAARISHSNRDQEASV